MPALRFLITALPKSGIHLLDNMLAPIAKMMSGSTRACAVWVTAHAFAGWGTGLTPKATTMERLENMLRIGHGGGHLAALVDVVAWCLSNEVAVIHLYRDLREVAVSEAYHVANPSKEFLHPYKAELAALPTHKARISAILQGYREHAPLRQRWELFAGWLNVPWVLNVPFNDLVTDKEGGAWALLNYLTMTSDVQFPYDLVHAMVAASSPLRSQTFRKGVAGSWRDDFDGELIEIGRAALGPWWKWCEEQFEEVLH